MIAIVIITIVATPIAVTARKGLLRSRSGQLRIAAAAAATGNSQCRGAKQCSKLSVDSIPSKIHFSSPRNWTFLKRRREMYIS
ncbi:MAG: hypothetical protein ABL900_13540 [Burkholderiaceae bacterium]